MNTALINRIALIHPIINIVGMVGIFIAAMLKMEGLLPRNLLANLITIYAPVTLFLMIPSGLLLCCFARHIQLLRYCFLVIVTGGSVFTLFASCWMLHFLVH